MESSSGRSDGASVGVVVTDLTFRVGRKERSQTLKKINFKLKIKSFLFTHSKILHQSMSEGSFQPASIYISINLEYE